MLKKRLSLFLPLYPNLKLARIKIWLGVIFLIFFLNYQPTLNFPPVREPSVKAQTLEQSQQVTTESLPIVFQLPHPGYLSTHFSSFHPGVDIATGLGMPIKPVAPGMIVNTGFNFWGLGLVVEIDHGYGYRSLYAHMGKIYVQSGQQVSESNTLGEVGLTGFTTGPHTHLELFKDSTRVNPVVVLPKIREFPKTEDFVNLTKPSDIKKENLTPANKVSDQIDFKKELAKSL